LIKVDMQDRDRFPDNFDLDKIEEKAQYFITMGKPKKALKWLKNVKDKYVLYSHEIDLNKDTEFRQLSKVRARSVLNLTDDPTKINDEFVRQILDLINQVQNIISPPNEVDIIIMNLEKVRKELDDRCKELTGYYWNQNTRKMPLKKKKAIVSKDEKFSQVLKKEQETKEELGNHPDFRFGYSSNGKNKLLYDFENNDTALDWIVKFKRLNGQDLRDFIRYHFINTSLEKSEFLERLILFVKLLGKKQIDEERRKVVLQELEALKSEPTLQTDPKTKITIADLPERLELLFLSISKYKTIMGLLATNGLIDPNTYIWVDHKKSNKSFLATIIKKLHSLGYYKQDKMPTRNQIKAIAINSFGWDISVHTIARTKPNDNDIDLRFLPPATTIK